MELNYYADLHLSKSQAILKPSKNKEETFVIDNFLLPEFKMLRRLPSADAQFFNSIFKYSLFVAGEDNHVD